MADTKISALSATTALAATDELVLARAGTTVKIDAHHLPGYEFAYAELTGNVTVSATAEATPTSVVSAAAVAFDGSTRVKIECFFPQVECGSTAGSYVIFTLWDGSTDLGRIAYVAHSLLVFSPYTVVKGERYLTPSAATHTYKIQAWRVNANATVIVGAGGTGVILPGFIRITKA